MLRSLADLTWANPLVLRTVHGGSRRVQHLLVRLGYLGGLIGLVTLALLSAGSFAGPADLNDLAKAGSSVFAVIAYGQVIAVCLLAPLFMAGAIAAERSNQTYNILLTTPLSNLQVVLGALLGRLFFILALLLSGLPLFAVLLVFGGVPASAVFVAFAIAALTALFVGAVAMTLSVCRAGGRKAVFAFVITVAGLLVAVFLADFLWLRRVGTAARLGQTTALTPIHPLLVLEASVRSFGYTPPPPEQLASLPAPVRTYLGRPLLAFATLTAGLSAVLLIGCALVVRRIGQGAGGLAANLPAPLARVLRLNGTRTRDPRPVHGNPVAWKEAHTRGKVTLGILGRAALPAAAALATAGLLVAHHRGLFGNGPAAAEPFRAALAALLFVQITLVLLVAIYMAAGCVSREREDGTLDILLTTPVTPRQYIWGKLRGLVRFLVLLLAAPLLTLLAASVYTLVTGASAVHTATNTPVPLVPIDAAAVLALGLVPFVAVIVAVGIAFSLRTRTVIGAVVATLGVAAALGGLFTLCGFATAAQIPLLGPALGGLSPLSTVGMALSPHTTVAAYADDPLTGRITLFLGLGAATAAYAASVWTLINLNTRDFDQTVRRLSGR